MSEKPYQQETAYRFDGSSQKEPDTKQQVLSFLSRSWSSFTSKVKDVVKEVENEASKLKAALEEETENVKRALKESISDSPPRENTQVSKVRPPWEDFDGVDPEVAESVKRDILSISKSYRNFTNAPPEMPEDFKFNLDDWIPVALAALEHDSDLNKARFTLVPKVISEETFWKTYFFRVFIIKRAYNIPMNPSNTAGSSTEKPDSSTSSDVATSEQQKQQSTSPIPEESSSSATEVKTEDKSHTVVEDASTADKSAPSMQSMLAGSEPTTQNNDSETIEFASEYYDLGDQDKWKADFEKSLNALGVTETELIPDEIILEDD